MSFSDDDLKETRAALAPTLEATAAILPWVNAPREPRFPPEKTSLWESACQKLLVAWQNRHVDQYENFRPAVMALMTSAIDLGDVDLLRLAEAFASAADAFELPARAADPRLAAAIAAACESICVPGSIEHDGFPHQARHAAGRIEQVLTLPVDQLIRTPTLDRLFVTEAGDCLDRMHEALEQLPADAYAIKLAAEDIADLADPLELETIALLARALANRLTPQNGSNPDLEDHYLLAEIETRITELGVLVDTIEDQLGDTPSGR